MNERANHSNTLNSQNDLNSSRKVLLSRNGSVVDFGTSPLRWTSARDTPTDTDRSSTMNSSRSTAMNSSRSTTMNSARSTSSNSTQQTMTSPRFMRMNSSRQLSSRSLLSLVKPQNEQQPKSSESTPFSFKSNQKWVIEPLIPPIRTFKTHISVAETLKNRKQPNTLRLDLSSILLNFPHGQSRNNWKPKSETFPDYLNQKNETPDRFQSPTNDDSEFTQKNDEKRLKLVIDHLVEKDLDNLLSVLFSFSSSLEELNRITDEQVELAMPYIISLQATKYLELETIQSFKAMFDWICAVIDYKREPRLYESYLDPHSTNVTESFSDDPHVLGTIGFRERTHSFGLLAISENIQGVLENNRNQLSFLTRERLALTRRSQHSARIKTVKESRGSSILNESTSSIDEQDWDHDEDFEGDDLVLSPVEDENIITSPRYNLPSARSEIPKLNLSLGSSNPPPQLATSSRQSLIKPSITTTHNPSARKTEQKSARVFKKKPPMKPVSRLDLLLKAADDRPPKRTNKLAHLTKTEQIDDYLRQHVMSDHGIKEKKYFQPWK